MPRKKSLKKIFFLWLLILVVGGFGGFLIEHTLLPLLARTSFCQRWQFFKNLGRQTTIINRTEEIKITENDAWQKIIDRALRSVVVVKVINNKTLVSQANGLVLTSDGLVMVPANLIDSGQNYLVNHEGEDLKANLFFKKAGASLTFLKIEKVNLSVLPLASLEKIRLGESVVLAGISVDEKGNGLPFVNQGIISRITTEGIFTSIQENDLLAHGSVLLNLDGEVIGLNLIDKNKHLVTIDALKIKNLLEESLKQNRE